MSEHGELRLGRYTAAVEARLAKWQEESFGRRLWEKDPTLWSPGCRSRSLRTAWVGWSCPLPRRWRRWSRLSRARPGGAGRKACTTPWCWAWAARAWRPRSSRTPSATRPGFSGGDGAGQHPSRRRARPSLQRLDPASSLFVVSSKSGTTTETLSFFRYFWDVDGGRAATADGHFVAVTDPGTPLQTLARERGFRAVFNAPQDVGGRYSALTPFGLVPAALLGIDLQRLLGARPRHGRGLRSGVPAAENPGLRLGAALGELALAGRDKVTFVTSPVADLLSRTGSSSSSPRARARPSSRATSTGASCPWRASRWDSPDAYGDDRFFAALILEGDDASGIEERLGGPGGGRPSGGPLPAARPLRPRGRDVPLGGGHGRGRRGAGAQPLRSAGRAARQGAGGQGHESGSERRPACGEQCRARRGRAGPRRGASRLDGRRPSGRLSGNPRLPARLGRRPRTPSRTCRRLCTRRPGWPSPLGYGPRFLHSTGQLHKGGPDRCRFLQIVDQPVEDVAVPETSYTFGTLIAAQAEGDRQALEQRGRTVLRVQLGGDVAGGLAGLLRAVEAAA